MIKDLGAGIHDDLQGFQAAFEIGDEHLDGAAGLQLADAADDQGKDRRTAVLALVAVDRRDHGMFELHGFDSLGDTFRLQPVQRLGAAVLDVAETAGAGADIAQHEEGCGSAAPALAHIRASGFLAYGVQGLLAHELLQALIGLAGWSAHADPIGAAQRGGVNFFGVDAIPGRLIWHEVSSSRKLYPLGRGESKKGLCRQPTGNFSVVIYSH